MTRLRLPDEDYYALRDQCIENVEEALSARGESTEGLRGRMEEDWERDRETLEKAYFQGWIHIAPVPMLDLAVHIQEGEIEYAQHCKRHQLCDFITRIEVIRRDWPRKPEVVEIINVCKAIERGLDIHYWKQDMKAPYWGTNTVWPNAEARKALG